MHWCPPQLVTDPLLVQTGLTVYSVVGYPNHKNQYLDMLQDDLQYLVVDPVVLVAHSTFV